MLEALCHEFSSFVTLTYSDEFLPEGGKLEPDDVRDWLKRLRKAIHPRRLRYYMVGEYGEKSRRPHYHGALFGLSQLETRVVEETWVKDGKAIGNVVLRELGPESAAYISGYVTKKLSSKEVSECGGVKEFQRMSLRPGIGAVAMENVVKGIQSLVEPSKLWKGDVPSVLRYSGKLWPIGRYLRRKIREGLGRDPDTPKSVVEEFRKQMQGLLASYVETAASEEERRFLKGLEKKSLIVGLQRQKVLDFVSRSKLFSQKRAVI